MAEAKKFFWLKLKDDFFEEKYIKAMRKLPDGDALVVIYLKLQLKSLKTEGIIKYDRIMPSVEEELALLLDEDVNKVRLAVKAILNMGIAELWENETLYMSAMQELVGSETSGAERVRRHRQQKALQCNATVTPCNTEIEKEKDIELDIDKEIESKSDKPTKPPRHKYGLYNNVLLSDDEMDKLKAEYPTDYQERIDRLSEYIESKGAKYKNHLATIRAWDRRDKEKNGNNKKPTEQKSSNPFLQLLKEGMFDE